MTVSLYPAPNHVDLNMPEVVNAVS